MQEKGLSNIEMLITLKNEPQLLTYEELTKFNDIMDAMGPHKMLILLYEGKFSNHWVCIFMNSDNQIEFFNPYGTEIDESLKHINPDFRKSHGEEFPHLTELLIKSDPNIPIVFNDFKFQQLSNNISTCGRWVVVRLLFSKLKLCDFAKIFLDNRFYSPDDLVSLLTSFIDTANLKP